MIEKSCEIKKKIKDYNKIASASRFVCQYARNIANELLPNAPEHLKQFYIEYANKLYSLQHTNTKIYRAIKRFTENTHEEENIY